MGAPRQNMPPAPMQALGPASTGKPGGNMPPPQDMGQMPQGFAASLLGGQAGGNMPPPRMPGMVDQASAGGNMPPPPMAAMPTRPAPDAGIGPMDLLTGASDRRGAVLGSLGGALPMDNRGMPMMPMDNGRPMQKPMLDAASGGQGWGQEPPMAAQPMPDMGSAGGNMPSPEMFQRRDAQINQLAQMAPRIFRRQGGGGKGMRPPRPAGGPGLDQLMQTNRMMR